MVQSFVASRMVLLVKRKMDLFNSKSNVFGAM